MEKKKRGWVGCGLNTAFTTLIKALTECVRLVSVLHFDNIYNKFSPHTSPPVPFPTLGHTSYKHGQLLSARGRGTKF